MFSHQGLFSNLREETILLLEEAKDREPALLLTSSETVSKVQMLPVERKEGGDLKAGEVVGVLTQENLEVSKGDLLGRRGMGLGGRGGGSGAEQIAFLPLGRLVGLTDTSSILVAGALKGEEVSSHQLDEKIEILAGTEGMMQNSQINAVLRGLEGEGKSPGVNSAIKRAGEGGHVLDSLVGLQGSSARGEIGLKGSSEELSIGDTKLGRWKLAVKDRAGERGLGGLSRTKRRWKEGERGLTGESEGMLRPAQIRQ
jgi:hypothetical protein